MVKRIGFACKWIDHPGQVDGIKPKDDCKKYNTGSTTVAWLNRQTKDVAVEKLWSLMQQNIEASRLLVERVGELDEDLRMVRLSSDILPVYTEPTWSWYWRTSDVRAYCEREFKRIGDAARSQGVRLSFHPGQFTVLASDNDDIVNRSIEEFEYHVDMARWMGYGQTFQDFKINVHIAGRRGPDGIRAVLNRLTPEARNTLTIENEEITHNLDTCLELADVVPIVLDIHHHWINSGEYIRPSDDRVKKVIDSWRGVRPTCHYSVSREEYFDDHSRYISPDLRTLLESGHKKAKLRAHSDYYWNTAVNEWALSFRENFDIMCESKAKNLASFALYEQAKGLTQPLACDRESLLS
jgi:UV DNA damage repair endonuclease